MSFVDVSSATTFLLQVSEVLLPLIYGNPLAITTGTMATVVAAGYLDPFRMTRQESSFLQKLRSNLWWLATGVGLFVFLKWPISSIYIVIITSALFNTFPMTNLPWFHGWPVAHIILALTVWFVASLLASFTEDALKYVMGRIKKLILAFMRCIRDGVRDTILMVVSMLLVVPLWIRSWIINRIYNEEEENDDNSMTDSREEEYDDSEVNLDAENFWDDDEAYQFRDRPDCPFYFEEEEDFGFLEEQQSRAPQVSTLRRSARLFGGQEEG